VDYVSAADPESLQEAEVAGERILFSLAVAIGRTRLIDNLPVSADESAADPGQP
jgi:pantothenate synthetase